jgi:hypothetical protein
MAKRSKHIEPKLDDIAFLKKSVYNIFKTIDYLFIADLSIATIVLISKLFGKESFKWNDIEFPLDKSWIVFALLTIANIYCALQLKTALSEIIKLNDKKLNKEVYNEVTSSENIFIRGINRRPIFTSTWGKMSFDTMPSPKRDMAYWLRLFISILILLAISITNSNKHLNINFTNLNIAFLILLINSFFSSIFLTRFYYLAYEGRDKYH